MNDTPHDNQIQAASVAEACHPSSQTVEEAALSTDATPDPCRPTASDTDTLEAPCSDSAISANPHADSDSDCDAACTEASPYGLDELRGELNALREQLASVRAREERTAREYEEFRQLYPDVSLANCPDAVWHAVENGTPLAAAYALEERRQALTAARAVAANEQNKSRSAGRVTDATGEFYTPEEVRAMSQSEVRANLSKIMKSMKKW